MSDSYCSRCGRLITFVRTERGKMMPCDAARVNFTADPRGDAFVYLEDGVSAHGWVLSSVGEGTVKAYRPHWKSCAVAVSARGGAVQGAGAVAGAGAGTGAGQRPVRKAAEQQADAPAVLPMQTKGRGGAQAADSFEQLSLFKDRIPRIKERCSAFDV